ncbi:MAG: amino acid/polyamine/organocation transporter, superfamily [Actinomycetia bacterium]|jgi:hypothetical protein|nr:amino acid/polyamine/organocation transporter, superfamily [Actinomycetes bacterium]
MSAPTVFRPTSAQVHAGVLEALAYAESIAPEHAVAVTVVERADDADRLHKQWAELAIHVPLETVISPRLDLTEATLAYVAELQRHPDVDVVTVLIPELFVEHWWQHLLHNQSSLILKGKLLFRRGTVVTSMPYRLQT